MFPPWTLLDSLNQHRTSEKQQESYQIKELIFDYPDYLCICQLFTLFFRSLCVLISHKMNSKSAMNIIPFLLRSYCMVQ